MFFKILKSFNRFKDIFINDNKKYEERFQKFISQVTEKARNATELEWQGKLKLREEELIREYEFQLMEKSIQLNYYSKIISDLQDQLSDAQKAYQNYYQDSITNNRLIAEVAHNIEKLFNTSGQIFQSFKNIQDAADYHINKMTKEDDSNRALLKMKKAKEILLNPSSSSSSIIKNK